MLARDPEARGIEPLESNTADTVRGDENSDLNLTRKLALVTGSRAGIGHAIAAALAREGAAVAEEVAWQYPEVEILVNNLGIFEPKPFEEILDADWGGSSRSTFSAACGSHACTSLP